MLDSSFEMRLDHLRLEPFHALTVTLSPQKSKLDDDLASRGVVGTLVLKGGVMAAGAATGDMSADGREAVRTRPDSC